MFVASLCGIPGWQGWYECDDKGNRCRVSCRKISNETGGERGLTLCGPPNTHAPPNTHTHRPIIAFPIGNFAKTGRFFGRYGRGSRGPRASGAVEGGGVVCGRAGRSRPWIWRSARSYYLLSRTGAAASFSRAQMRDVAN